MINGLRVLVELIGVGNAVSILTFLIGLFVSFYFYYKSFYRLVFSESRICETCYGVKDWVNPKTKFTSRVIFYNNGRKTLTKSEVKKVNISSAGKITSIKTIAITEDSKCRVNHKKKVVEIDFLLLDSSNYVVVEIDHFGLLSVTGRIVETGKILHSEPTSWKLINIICSALTIIPFCYTMVTFTESNTLDGLPAVLLNMAVVMLTISILRYFHSILFIPDRITSKYLGTKDKFNKQFRNNF